MSNNSTANNLEQIAVMNRGGEKKNEKKKMPGSYQYTEMTMSENISANNLEQLAVMKKKEKKNWPGSFLGKFVSSTPVKESLTLMNNHCPSARA